GRGRRRRGAAADELLRRNLGAGERHHRSGCRPLRRTARLCRRPGLLRHRQRDRQAAVGEVALDLALDIVSELARAELGEIEAVVGAQAPDLALVVRALRGEPAGLVDEAVPDVDVDDARLLGPAAVELVEIGRILAGFGAAL